ncbi:hypothetical protein Aut01nite_65950 [Actinoplanes utahensis]|nr:hypothetical protein Aut01nite_65950 [Actinoplanes utahensis]
MRCRQLPQTPAVRPIAGAFPGAALIVNLRLTRLVPSLPQRHHHQNDRTAGTGAFIAVAAVR